MAKIPNTSQAEQKKVFVCTKTLDGWQVDYPEGTKIRKSTHTSKSKAMTQILAHTPGVRQFYVVVVDSKAAADKHEV